MRNLKGRCAEDEQMDDPNLSEVALNEALKDISFVNKWLGGNAITVKAVASLINEFPDKINWTIADVGCGDGEMLRILSKYFDKSPLTIEFIGIDISEKGLQRARSLSKDFTNIQYENIDILDTNGEIKKYDIVISTLTLHHIKEFQIVDFLKGMLARSQYGIIVNDLERSKIAYGLFSIFSRIFIKSSIAKNDGLISIASAFKRKDLEKYSQSLGLNTYTITWKWAFRYLWYIKLI